MRCDAFFPTTTRDSSPRTTNVSAKGIADAPPTDFWACTDKPPDGADQPFVSCDRPHNYERGIVGGDRMAARECLVGRLTRGH
jgi:hypothetical protein